jgi:tRNA pseudouridine13 synthase
MTPTERAIPIVIGRLYDDLEPVVARLGDTEDHFFVSEVPAYEFSGVGEHLFVHIEKRGLATPEALRLIEEMAAIPNGQIGYAGLKDKHAVTRQWLSMMATAVPAVETWQLPDSLRVLETARHGNKLRVGHLKGNCFRLGLVDVEAGANADGVAATFLEHLVTHGFANIFDAQRFGHDGRNLDIALDWIGRGASRRRVRDRRRRAFLASVVQSELFNRYFARRWQLGFDKLIEGEWVRLDGAGSGFVVEDLEKEQLRLESGDLHLTGPLPGPKMRAADGEAQALEAEVCKELGLDDQAMLTLGTLAPGTRRDLLVRPTDAQWSREGDHEATLSFQLPAGTYATRLLFEMTAQSAHLQRASRGPSSSDRSDD